MFGAHAFQVADTIWCVRRSSYFTCSYGVQSAHGVVLIDAGMDSSGADVGVLLDAMGRTVDDVQAVLLTHWHNDHSAGAGAIARKTGCRVYYHAGDRAQISGVGPKRGGFRQQLARKVPEWGVFVLAIGLLGEAVSESVEATTTCRDGDVVEDEFEILETPGHTPGHVSVFHRPTQALFAGDALAVINGHIRYMARPVTPDLTLARRSIERCLSVSPRVLCPGHREPLTRDVVDRIAEMRRRLNTDKAWPIFG